MNEREIRRLVQPLVARHGDLAYTPRAIVLTPVRHFLRAVLFERLGDKANVDVSVQVQACCRGPGYIALSFTNKRWPKDNLWWPGREGFPEAMFETVEKNCLEELRKISSFNDYVSFESRFHMQGYVGTYFEHAYIAMMQGRFADAGAIFAKWDFAEHHDLLLEGYASRLAHEGDDLSTKDKRAILRILHEREAAAIKAMKLEKHWIPTSFPAEEQGLV